MRNYIPISLFFLILFFCQTNSSSQNITILPSPINSDQYRTVAPYMSYDGKSIVFIMQKEESQKLVECKFKSGKWEGPFYIDVVNNFDSVPFFIEAPTYNHDASEIYFSLKYDQKEADFDIYIVKNEKGNWLKPERLPEPVNSDKNDIDPFISFDGKQLFLARTYENESLKKFDCYEILVSEKTQSGWKNPVALPAPVNSGCDKAPRMASDGKTLYFSSIRGDGKTLSDLYYAKRITKNAWTSPVRIDTVNNLEDETYPSVPIGGDYLYFQHGVGKKKERTDKFVRFEQNSQFKPEKTIHVFGDIRDLKTDKPIFAKINVIDPNTSIILFEAKTNELTGKYSFYLQNNKKYRIDFYNENYSHFFLNYDTRNSGDQTEVEQNIKLFPEVDLIVNVYDKEIYEPLLSNLIIYNEETGNKLEINPIQLGKGRFSVTLPIGENYKVEATKEHFESSSFSLDLRGVIQFNEFERDLELQVKKIDYLFSLSDEETGEGVEAEVEIVNLSTNERIIKKVKTGKDGKLKIKLRDGTRYEINISPKGYSYYNTTVDLVGEDPITETDAKLTPLKKATKLELNDIIFESNSADLNKSSFEELDRMVKLLINNPQIKIEVSAHTDDVGTKSYNLKLSERRAESVKEYLFNKEISEEQIISKGYGESEPKYLPFNTDENRAKNRRVELEVLEIEE